MRKRIGWRAVSAALMAVAVCALMGAGGATTPHVFSYDARAQHPRPKSVDVAGDFNDWSTSANALNDDGHGVFTAGVDLSPGVHHYKFVLDGSKWVNDPKADKKLEEDDTYGGKNSGVVIGAAGSGGAVSTSTVDPDTADGHLFRFDPRTFHDGAVDRVNVAGDFNGWSSMATPMDRQGDGTFTVRTPLTDGVHFYKFVVNGDKWVNDPASDKALEQDDGNGGRNSAVLIGPDARKLGPQPVGAVNGAAVRHDPNSITDLNVASPTLVKFAIRTQADDLTSAAVLIQSEGATDWTAHDLYKLDRPMGFDRYATAVEFPGKPFKYLFALTDTGHTFYYAGGQLFADQRGAAVAAYTCDGECAFQTPDWAKHAVWYQIFPERFRNGDSSNDPPGTQRWQSKWFSVLPGEAPGMENFYKGQGNVWKRRYGGDVQGLKESLPYLRDLGITAIYLNPMFEADSMHKYDTSDYRHIDEHFGVKGDIEQLTGETDAPATWQWTASDKLFLDFVAEAHRMGFKVILDGVFNHVGRDFWAFKDVLKNGKNSKYAGWFDVRDWTPPIKYIAWDTGNTPTSDGALPILRKDPKLGLVHGPREHVMAITKRWLAPDGDPSRGVDGWRLDVPGDIPHPFWKDWRKLVKSTKGDAFISGEIWPWAQPWLKGDEFDAVMNYRFADAAQKFFVNRRLAATPTQFAGDLDAIVNNYPLQVSMTLMNLFDSHDTDRLASMFVNPDLPYDAHNRIQDNGPDYSPAKPSPEQWTRMRQAVDCQMTFLGAPMIYYGDEAGMWGPDDPSDRQPMVWKDLQPFDDPQVKFDDAQFKHYQRDIAIRHTLPALQTGYFHPVRSDDKTGVLAYARTLGGQTIYVVLNRSASPRTVRLPVTDGAPAWVDLAKAPDPLLSSPDPAARATVTVDGAARVFRVDHGTMSVPLAPYSTAILAPAAR